MNCVSIGSGNGLSPGRRHYMNQCWLNVNWTLRNKRKWNSNQNTKLFIRENVPENVICETVAILPRGDELSDQSDPWPNIVDN